MLYLIKKYNSLLYIFLLFMSIAYLFGLKDNELLNKAVDIVGFVFMVITLLTCFLSSKYNDLDPVYNSILTMILVIITIFIVVCETYSFNVINDYTYFIVLPCAFIIIDDIRISERFMGFLIVIYGIVSLFKIGDLDYINGISPLLIVLSIFLMYKEENLQIRLLYVISGASLVFAWLDKIYYAIFLILIELVVVALDEKTKKRINVSFYMIMFIIYFSLLMIEQLPFVIPVYVFGAIMFKSALARNRDEIIFYAKDMNIGGIEKSLVNLVNSLDKKLFNITIVLEEKKGPLLDKIDRKVYVRQYKVFNLKYRFIQKGLNFIKSAFYSLFNYHTYDFSCCYATYSYCCNKLSRIASDNPSIYVHNEYFSVYKKEEDSLNFFDTRNMDKFKKIIFVSNESRDTYLKHYPKQIDKLLVINNIIDINAIEEKKKEIVEFKRPRGKKLLVYVGRLDEDAKRITRILEIVRELDNVILWIIGDGPDRAMYEKIIKEYEIGNRVTMYGAINDPYNYMDRADYIILTSDYEGFPVVYLEALVLKKEIITTYPVSDDKINMRERANIISRDDYVEEVRQIIKGYRKKNKDFNFREVQYNRVRNIERIIRE